MKENRKEEKMEIKQVVTGVLEENCYVLSHDKKCLVIDPGDEIAKIEDAIQDKKVVGVLITHAHSDHIGALRNFLKRRIPVYKKSNLEEEKEYNLGPFQFKVLFTPGHSSDSVSFYFEKEKILFTGDFVFKGSIGRVDLPSGNEEEMKESLSKLKQMDENITLYPGHGMQTNLLDEKQYNVYFN